MVPEEESVESLMAQFGTTGKYQTRQYILHFFVAFLSGLHMFSLTFIAATPRHRCYIQELDAGLADNNNVSLFEKEILSRYIPIKADGELDSCHRYSAELPFDNGSVDAKTTSRLVEQCNGQFVYDTSIYQQSRVYDFHMVCENKWKRAFIQSIYVFGVFSGALFCGSLSDRYGRKIVLCGSGILQFVFAIAQPYFTNFVLYSGSLFFYGMFGSAGAYVTAFVMSMELVHKSNRTYCGVIFNSSFAVGACFVAIYGYFIRDIWLLQTVYAMHAAVLLGYWFLVDESIRWLWTQKRVEEAVKIANNAVKLNGGSFSNNYKIPQTHSTVQPQGSKFGLSDLFRLPIMRFRAIITAFNWFAISLCFYGLAFNMEGLTGDPRSSFHPYLVFLILAFADLPGFLLVALLFNKTGRRPLNSTLLCIGGVVCIVTTVIPRGMLVRTGLAILAKVILACNFAIIYSYTAELFPTMVRNSALGLCTMSSRLAGTLVPQITLLNSIDKSIPSLVFGGIAVCASFAFLFLPETLNKELPQTLEDGENYNKDDTAFNTLCNQTRDSRKNMQMNSEVHDKMLVE
ncbi:organic cation transporter protein [Folsomia candida]|uniref:Organic cation transporter protein n=1 Tax=Folsomia candida TaxID=158441 RepID=A0A226ERA0_FOLCA|nr:organic cation transporter protein [Folsomia candida]OXA60155.1 Organic cation transporter protein [Folsomia candida]